MGFARAAGLLGAQDSGAGRGEADGNAAAEEAEEPAAVEREPVEGRDLVLRELGVPDRCPPALSHFASPFPGRGLDGREDPRIRAAAADVARERSDDVLRARIGVRLQQGDRRDDHSGRAVAALKRLFLEKRRLDRMEPAVLGEPLDRDDLLARRFGDRRLAGRRRLPVEQHHAGAALTFPATVLGSGQLETIAQDREERFVGRGVDGSRSAVDGENDSGHPQRF